VRVHVLKIALVLVLYTGNNKVRINKPHRLTERDSRLAHYFALLWGLGLRFGYLATSGAKSDVTFLLSDPDFLIEAVKFLAYLT